MVGRIPFGDRAGGPSDPNPQAVSAKGAHPLRVEIAALRRELENFGCKSHTLSLDAEWIRRALAAEAEVARQKGQPPAATEKTKHPVIVRAEAYALFNGYLEQESRRLSEKLRLLEAGCFDDAAAEQDGDWRRRNEKLGESAVARESEACQLAATLTATDLFDGLPRDSDATPRRPEGAEARRAGSAGRSGAEASPNPSQTNPPSFIPHLHDERLSNG